MARLTLNGMYDYDNTLFEGMVLPPDYDTDALFFEIMNRCGQLYPYHQQPVVLKSAIRLWFSRNYLGFDRSMEALLAEYSPIENVYENRKETTTYGSSEIHSGSVKDTESNKDTVTHSEKDSTERTFDQYHDKTERTYDQYHDKTERVYPSNDKLTETNTKTGSITNEHEVSAFDSNSYQASTKDTETFNQVEDTKTTAGSYYDDHTETGSYKDDRTETGSYKDETVFGHKITTEYGHINTRSFENETNDHVGIDTFEVFRHGNIGVTTNQYMINEELELRRFDIYVDIASRFEREFMVQVY